MKKVTFKYERLTPFCYVCGLLEHTDRACKRYNTILEKEIQKEWGPWLRAPSRRNNGVKTSRWLKVEDDDVIDDMETVVQDGNPTAEQESEPLDGLIRGVNGGSHMVSQNMIVAHENSLFCGGEKITACSGKSLGKELMAFNENLSLNDDRKGGDLMASTLGLWT